MNGNFSIKISINNIKLLKRKKILYNNFNIMSKTLTQKKNICAQIENILNNYNTCIIVEHSTITGDEFAVIRKTMKKAGSEILCVKKNLFNRVLKDEFKNLSDQNGSLMMVYSNDPLVTISNLNKTIRKIKGFNFHNSIVESKLIDVEGIKKLSKYSDKNSLLSVTLSHMKLPTFQLVDVLEKIKEKKTA